MIQRILCTLTGHRWVEQLPHRAWDINAYQCNRCHDTASFNTWGERIIVKSIIE